QVFSNTILSAFLLRKSGQAALIFRAFPGIFRNFSSFLSDEGISILRFFLKAIALFTSVTLLFEQSLLADFPSITRNEAAAVEVKLSSENSGFFLPPGFGKVVQSSGTNPSVFLIQDPHGHYEAQKKIQSILEFLHRTSGFSTLWIEG